MKSSLTMLSFHHSLLLLLLLVVAEIFTPQTIQAMIGSYNINIVYVDPVDKSISNEVDASVARWKSVVIGTHSSRVAHAPPGVELCQGEPNSKLTQPMSWNDLLIFVRIHPIDGPANILGQSFICGIDRDNMPRIGWLELDLADVKYLLSQGKLRSTITHEMGHLHGIGITWSKPFNLLNRRYQYTGAGGIQGDNDIGYPGRPIVENKGGQGTAWSHWRESIYQNELMTGWLSGATQPFSALTGRSLTDLGFVIDPNSFDDFQVSAVRGGFKHKKLRGSASSKLGSGGGDDDSDGDRRPYHSPGHKDRPDPWVVETTDSPE
jgi:hypothetical protein